MKKRCLNHLRTGETPGSFNGDLKLHARAVLVMGASIVAIAISRFNVGDQAVVVARPICRALPEHGHRHT
jgi:hypothetical protein